MAAVYGAACVPGAQISLRIHGGYMPVAKPHSGRKRGTKRLLDEASGLPARAMLTPRSMGAHSFPGATHMSIVHRHFASGPDSTAEVVIALHCSASGGRQWDAYPKLLPPGMRLLAPELMGYRPGETWPPGTPVSIEAEARELAPLLFSTAGEVHLVGHSYGGAVALEMALRWPHRIKTLTLFEPVRFALLADHDHESTWKAILSVGRRIGWHARSGRLEEAAALFVDYWSGSGAWAGLSAGRQRAIAERMPKVRAEFEALFADPVPASTYSTLKMPVRIITGSTSPLPARTVTCIIARHCAQAEVMQLDGVGHMGPISHASMVASRLAFQPREAELPLAA
jgi:pimeloyl-ACP methyl ester carboxylesterase